MTTRNEVERLLRRLLHAGRLRGFPRNPVHRDTVLAVAASGLIRRHAYTEPKINEYLIEWLASVHALVDHVTLRRRLVDCGFLKRTTNGSRYLLNYPRVAGILGDPTLEVDAGAMLEDILAEREARKLAACGTWAR